MNVIIAGSRDFQDYAALKNIMDQMIDSVELVISGCAPGADSLGERWAQENNILIKQFPADWKEYGKFAGPIRNKQMANFADYAVLFWDGKSPGTKNMIRQMSLLKKPFLVNRYVWKTR